MGGGRRKVGAEPQMFGEESAKERIGCLRCDAQRRTVRNRGGGVLESSGFLARKPTRRCQRTDVGEIGEPLNGQPKESRRYLAT